MTGDKTRAKALKTAVQFKGSKEQTLEIPTLVILVESNDIMQWFIGVTAVEIKGDHRNQIEVTGDEVDMICLTNTLRKKVAFAELVSVNKVEPPKPDDKKPEEKKPEEKKPEEKKPEPCCPPWPYGYGVPSCYPYPCDPYHYIGEPVYNQEPNCKPM